MSHDKENEKTEEISRLTRELMEEMNVRLFLDADSEQVLFVESITVTEIRIPQIKKKEIFWKRIVSHIRRIRNIFHKK